MSRRILAGVLIAGGAVGLLTSLMLTIELIHVLENPAYQPACNISPIVSCTSVMTTPQGDLLGFSNSLIGIVGFSVVITLGSETDSTIGRHDETPNRVSLRLLTHSVENRRGSAQHHRRQP